MTRKEYKFRIFMGFIIGTLFIIAGALEFKGIEILRIHGKDVGIAYITGGLFILSYDIYAVIMLIKRGKDWPPSFEEYKEYYHSRKFNIICLIFFTLSIILILLKLFDTKYGNDTTFILGLIIGISVMYSCYKVKQDYK